MGRRARGEVGAAAATWELVESLRGWAQNPRLNADAILPVALSIFRFGFGAPIVARAADREVIAGHTRLAALEYLAGHVLDPDGNAWRERRPDDGPCVVRGAPGPGLVPVRLLDLSEHEAHALALADNRLGEIADWDDEKLSGVLADLDSGGIDLSGLGWSDAELAEVRSPQLPDDERAPFDAYYTPAAHALACCRWLRDEGGIVDPADLVEPSVGGGSWVAAVREVWPEARLDRCDVNGEAPGLTRGLRPDEVAHTGDWLLGPSRRWSLGLGNPPYGDDVLPFLEATLARCGAVAMVLRETITGTSDRLSWWRDHPPAFVVKLSERPKWEGPGARTTADFADSILVVWIEDQADTRFRWLSVDDTA